MSSRTLRAGCAGRLRRSLTTSPHGFTLAAGRDEGTGASQSNQGTDSAEWPAETRQMRHDFALPRYRQRPQDKVFLLLFVHKK
jgi:hypothetical protein